MSGYQIYLNDTACEKNLSRFEVQGFDEQLSRWVVAAACNFRYLETSIRFLPGPCYGPKLSVDLRPPWPIKLLAAVRVVVSLCFVSIAAFGAMGAPRHSESVLKLALLFLAAIYVASAAGFAASFAQREALLYALYAAILLCALAALRCDPSLAPHAAVLLGAAGLVARAVTDCGCFADCAQLADGPPLELAGLTVCGLLYLAYQHSALRTVLRAAAADKAAYDHEWQRIETGPERAALDRLTAADDALRLCARARPRGWRGVGGGVGGACEYSARRRACARKNSAREAAHESARKHSMRMSVRWPTRGPPAFAFIKFGYSVYKFSVTL